MRLIYLQIFIVLILLFSLFQTELYGSSEDYFHINGVHVVNEKYIVVTSYGNSCINISVYSLNFKLFSEKTIHFKMQAACIHDNRLPYYVKVIGNYIVISGWRNTIAMPGCVLTIPNLTTVFKFKGFVAYSLVTNNTLTLIFLCVNVVPLVAPNIAYKVKILGINSDGEIVYNLTPPCITTYVRPIQLNNSVLIEIYLPASHKIRIIEISDNNITLNKIFCFPNSILIYNDSLYLIYHGNSSVCIYSIYGNYARKIDVEGKVCHVTSICNLGVGILSVVPISKFNEKVFYTIYFMKCGKTITLSLPKYHITERKVFHLIIYSSPKNPEVFRLGDYIIVKYENLSYFINITSNEYSLQNISGIIIQGYPGYVINSTTVVVFTNEIIIMKLPFKVNADFVLNYGNSTLLLFNSTNLYIINVSLHQIYGYRFPFHLSAFESRSDCCCIKEFGLAGRIFIYAYKYIPLICTGPLIVPGFPKITIFPRYLICVNYCNNIIYLYNLQNVSGIFVLNDKIYAYNSSTMFPLIKGCKLAQCSYYILNSTIFRPTCSALKGSTIRSQLQLLLLASLVLLVFVLIFLAKRRSK